MDVRERLRELGHTLPRAVPGGDYKLAVRRGPVVYCAGQIPKRDGALQYKGKVGREITIAEGAEAAVLCALNSLAAIESVAGDLALVKRILRVVGYVNADPELTDVSGVLNGASQLFRDVFGENGTHARTAVGVVALPAGAAVELEVTAELHR